MKYKKTALRALFFYTKLMINIRLIIFDLDLTIFDGDQTLEIAKEQVNQ